MDDLPPLPGSYVLILHLGRDCSIRIGRLGEWGFPAGYYLYLGSARGPGGLRARLGRHLRGPAHLHWHIDYLRRWALPVEVWYVPDDRPVECLWQAALAAAGLRCPVPGFGSSDCACPAHLFYSPGRPAESLRLCLQETTAGTVVRRCLSP